VGPMAQTAEHRRASKAINYGIIYGLSPFGLAQQIGVPQKEAAQFISAYFERYRGVKKYLDNVLMETRKREWPKRFLAAFDRFQTSLRHKCRFAISRNAPRSILRCRERRRTSSSWR